MLFLDGFELLDDLFPFGGETGAAATLAAGQTINQRFFRQVVDQVDRIPGSFVADADRFGGLGDRPEFVDLFQQIDPVIPQILVVDLWNQRLPSSSIAFLRPFIY